MDWRQSTARAGELLNRAPKGALELTLEPGFVNTILMRVAHPWPVQILCAVSMLEPFGCLSRRMFPNPAWVNQFPYSLSV